jgi:heme-degrading monooxygenase HmoA
MNESPVLLHVWQVDPGEEAAVVARLQEMLGEVVKDLGFVSARVLESADHTSVAVTIEMRSVEDRQRLEQLPEVRSTLDNLPGAANLIIKLYHEVASYAQ